MFISNIRNASGAAGHYKRCHPATNSARGFTLIELMIVIAIVAILLSLALPVYSNYTIRAKIGEALSLAKGAKTAVSVACQEDPNLTDLTNSNTGYSVTPDMDATYVDTITISETCAAPLISVLTQDTGFDGDDPVIQMIGENTLDSGRIYWDCTSPNTPAHLLPPTCRS